MDVLCDGIVMRDLLRTCSLHNLPEQVTLQSMILRYQAALCQSKQLVPVGDLVKLNTTAHIRKLHLEETLYQIILG